MICFTFHLPIKMHIITKPFRSILERVSNGDNKSLSRVQESNGDNKSLQNKQYTERLNTHTHTHVGFYGLRGLSIGVMVFILYKLYVLLPYTYPTPKLSPHRRRCIYIFPQKKLTLYDL